MSSHGSTTQRITPSLSDENNESKNPTMKQTTSISDSSSIKTIKNLGKFSPQYAIFIWSVLFITLVLNNKIYFPYLVSVTKVAFLYFAFLHTLPDFVVLHNTATDPKIVYLLLFVILSLLLVVTFFELILTELIIYQYEFYLFASFSATLPLILLHAGLSKGDDPRAVNEEMIEEIQERGDGDQSENMV